MGIIRIPRRGRKKRKPTPVNRSCGKCIFFGQCNDLGNTFYCFLYKKYKKYRTGCEFRETDPSKKDEVIEKFKHHWSKKNTKA